MVCIYNLFSLDFHRPSLSYFVGGVIDRFSLESAVGIISVRFSMRASLTETFRWLFPSGYFDGKHCMTIFRKSTTANFLMANFCRKSIANNFVTIFYRNFQQKFLLDYFCRKNLTEYRGFVVVSFF